MKMLAAVGAVLISTLFAPTIFSQNDPQNDSQKIAEADRDFLEKAAQANLAEIETGKLAQSKATQADVKQFGQQMEQDHGKTLKELQVLAKNRGIKLPDMPDEAHQAQAQQLARASGKAFERSYVAHAGVADHKAAKKLFEKGARSQDAEISAFAKKLLPHIEHHLQMAQVLAAKG